jgi:hypothetical protein
MRCLIQRLLRRLQLGLDGIRKPGANLRADAAAETAPDCDEGGWAARLDNGHYRHVITGRSIETAAGVGWSL